MRLIPAITALLVMASLYLLVFEREALLAFAEGRAVEADVDAEQSDETPQGVAVFVRRSVAQNIDSGVVLRGQTEAFRQVNVLSQTSAVVISEPLRRGAFVNEGDLLCQLDPGTREATLAQAIANLAEAKTRVPEAEARVEEARAALAEAKINDNAAQRLSDNGFASETRVASTNAAVRAAEAAQQSAQSGLEAARAGIRAAEAQVASARTEIDWLTITAPFSGLLESDTAELGSLLQPGALCATVIALDPLKLVGFVPETEVTRIDVGALAGARLVTGERLTGRVTFLSRSADPETRTFRVEIEVPNPGLRLRDGQTAEIVISAEGARAHLLPQSALTLSDEGAIGVRIVEEGSVAAFRPITLVRDTVDGVWVTGLPETVDVILVGQEFVTDGVPLAPQYEEMTQ